MKYHKYYVTNGTDRARVSYSTNVASDGRKMITIYEKDYENELPKLFNNVENDTDYMTDYFEENRVRVYEDNPLYEDLYAKMQLWGFTYA